MLNVKIFFCQACFELWNLPVNWTSGDPVFYRSLDAGTCFRLINGSQSIAGKVGTRKTWFKLNDKFDSYFSSIAAIFVIRVKGGCHGLLI